MNLKKSNPARNSRGQSLVETALMLPLLLLLVLNVVNLGYFFLIIVNLTGAARNSTEYSTLGNATPTTSLLPSVGPGTSTCPTSGNVTVANVAQQDMCGSLSWDPSNTCIEVCSENLGLTGSGASQVANCNMYSGTGTSCTGVTKVTPSADPEAPNFVLQEVDITYTFSTLFPGTIFNIPLQASSMCNSGTCTFVRRARMRAMN